MSPCRIAERARTETRQQVVLSGTFKGQGSMLQILYKICPLVVTIVCALVACTLARELKGYAEVKDCHDESSHLLDSYLEIFSNISDDLTRLQCAMLCQREDRCTLAVFVELLLTTRCLMFESIFEGKNNIYWCQT
nr:hypothetical protein BgiMline_026732 [Biomphalaria glabrata]